MQYIKNNPMIMKYKYYLDNLINNRTLLVLLSIVILGSILRLYHLGTPSLWQDELTSLFSAKLSFRELTTLFGAGSSSSLLSTHVRLHPPLYFYAVLGPWIKIFGDSEFAVRFPSVIFSLLSIIFIFKLAKKLFNEKAGLISAFLLSISPYDINYAQEARPYAMFWSLGILSFIFFLKFLKDNKIRSLLFYVITVAILSYTMNFWLLFIIIQNIIFFSLFNSNSKQSERWLLGQLAIILLYLPLVKNFIFISSFSKITPFGFKESSNFKILIGSFLFMAGHWIKPLNFIEVSLYSFLIISAVVWVKNIKNKKDILDFSKSDYFLFVWIIAPIMILYFVDIYFTLIFRIRYLSMIYAPLIILLGKSISKYNGKIKAVVLILLFSISLGRLYPYYEHNLKLYGQNWRELHQQLRKMAGKDDLIVYPGLKFVRDYYGNGIRAKSIDLREFERLDVDKLNYDTIFLVYKRKLEINKIKGYKPQEDYSDIIKTSMRIGFMRFVKSK